MVDVQSLRSSDVMQAYSGRPGCMCGCKGKYFVHSAHRALAAEDCGYAVDDEDVQDGQVTRILRLIQAEHANDEKSVEVAEDGQYVHWSNGKRVYCVYLAERAQKNVEAARERKAKVATAKS